MWLPVRGHVAAVHTALQVLSDMICIPTSCLLCFAFQGFLRGMGGSISLCHHFKTKVTLKDQPVFLASSSFGSLFAYILFKTFTCMFIMKVICSWHVLSAVRAPETRCVIFFFTYSLEEFEYKSGITVP